MGIAHSKAHASPSRHASTPCMYMYNPHINPFKASLSHHNTHRHLS
jgi:hypothetical protein